MSEKKREIHIPELLFAISGGLLLLYVGATGSAGGYIRIINLLIEYGFIQPDQASLGILALQTIASLGGISVIIGGLFTGFLDLRRIGNFFIDTGAGISMTMLIMSIIQMGPELKILLEAGEFYELGIKLGVGVGMAGVGTMLAFMATMRYYRWMMLLTIDGLMILWAGITIRTTELVDLITPLNIPPQLMPYVMSFLGAISFAGLALLLAALLVGSGYVGLSKFISLLVLILYIPSLITIVTSPSTMETFYVLRLIISILGAILLGYYIIAKVKKEEVVKEKEEEEFVEEE